MKKYEILMFDLDDTLIDNRENVRHAFKVILNEMNEEYTEEKFNRWYEIDIKFWLDRQNGKFVVPDEYKEEEKLKSKKFLDWIRAQRLLIYYDNKISLERAIELNNLFVDAMREVVVPIPGVKETLEYLSKKYKIFVVTNGPKLATRDKVDKIGCLDYIDKIYSAEMFGYMKPRIEFFDGVNGDIGCDDLDKYLMIGDSLKSDVEFGMNCGFDSCWINQKGIELDNKYKPTIIIKDIRELMKIL